MFGFGRKKKNVPIEQPVPAAEDGAFTIAEDSTRTPAVELIPSDWSRPRIMMMIRTDETSQSVKTILGIAALAVLAGVICAGFMFWGELSDYHIDRQKTEMSGLIGQYDKSISRAYGMDGILKYTQELSLAEQARALINICVNSNIVVHKLNMTHDIDLIPSNVRNSFEASTSLKLDKVNVHGVWIIDGSFVGERGGGNNEQWILSTNKTFASMFSGTRYSTFMDISTKTGQTGDRYEFVYLFWDASDSKKGAEK